MSARFSVEIKRDLRWGPFSYYLWMTPEPRWGARSGFAWTRAGAERKARRWLCRAESIGAKQQGRDVVTISSEALS